ncbi:PepSY domain-containing protein [Massilia sp. PAMC28688]|uniref:PepSY-associated TM helix domain-containing protein n=1 Tax=Massilia sp. PAMC28688 TaxID=2861283 RepID=UPI001C636674|nr:PepSY-associated TM helix domain-containing protein [Massilia sp. PAMC28688]QYF93655.1 PepSY domain-containing protein [Massilia sp. PAMC28688]
MTRFIHLWTSLIFGAILVLMGLTGSALAWIEELDHALNPTLFQVSPGPGLRAGAPLHMAPAQIDAVYQRLLHDPHYGKPSMLALPATAGEVVVAWYRPQPRADHSAWAMTVSRQVMLDPSTLVVTGERNWGESGLSRPLIMPTLFHLHRYLVAGDVGKIVISVTGVALLVCAVTGIILWWPRMTASAIWHALTVRHGGSWPRFSFQLHRAAGFFAAPVLAMLAFSGIYFNSPAWVLPAVKAVSHVTEQAKPLNRSGPGPVLAPGSAARHAQAAFPAARVSRISLPAGAGAPFEVRLRQDGELRHGPGATRVSVDARDGALLRVIDPLSARSGDRFLSWMFPLHTGEAFGTAGRVVISVFGVAPLMFMVTGLVIWLKLRRKTPKTRKAAPASARSAAPARPARLVKPL